MFCRLDAEKKATKKHVEATKSWKKQHKERVRAAERQTAQYDASDLHIPGAENVEQLDLEGDQSEDTNAEQLPIHQQAFFPQQVGCSFSPKILYDLRRRKFVFFQISR
jgi:hypothetical protein